MRGELDGWLRACRTPAQQADGRRFYDAAYGAVQEHLDAVAAVASAFETRWNGVFKGPLAPTTVDMLVEEQQIASSLDWFQPGEIEPAYDRSELLTSL